jgi:hypothetical protein
MYQLIDQLLAGGGIIPIARRFTGGGVIVVATLSNTISSLRIAARNCVTVSWVATPSSSGVESNTRARSLNAPDWRATTLVSSNSRRGRVEARSRLRCPTNTVG